MHMSVEQAPSGRHWQLSLPVLMKEMRSRMRGSRAPVLLLAFTGIAILVGLLIMASGWDNLTGDLQSAQRASAELGHRLTIALLSLLMALCALITPGLTAGSIAIEREQQTLDLLILTRLGSSNIITGKLLSSLSFLLILLLCTMPVASIAFVLGGTSPWELLLSMTLILAMVVCFGAVGMFCSARFQKTTVATTVAYIICLSWLGLVPALYWLIELYHSYSNPDTILIGLSLASLLLLLLATIPTFYIALLLELILHRRLARVTLISLWGVFAILAVLLLYLPNALDFTETQNFLFANPIVAMYMILTGSDGYLPHLGGYGYSTSSYGSSLFNIINIFASIALLLFGGWFANRLAIRELQRLRRIT